MFHDIINSNRSSDNNIHSINDKHHINDNVKNQQLDKSSNFEPKLNSNLGSNLTSIFGSNLNSNEPTISEVQAITSATNDKAIHRKAVVGKTFREAIDGETKRQAHGKALESSH